MTHRVRIPLSLRSEDFRLVKIAAGEKFPVEKGWQENNNYTWDDSELQEHLDGGGNYGVVCGYGALVVIDADKREVKEAVREFLPATFTVRTGGGGSHFYYLCKDLNKPIRLKEEKAGDLGDVQFTGKQVVGANSIHPSGKLYEVEDNLPVQKVSAEEIRLALKDFLADEVKDVVVEERKALDRSGIGGEIPITSVVPLDDLKQVGGEFQGSHPVHGSSTGRNFCVNPRKGVWHCFRHGTGGGSLSWLAVQEGIINCSEAVKGALRGRKFVRVLEKARGLGLVQGQVKVEVSKGEGHEETNIVDFIEGDSALRIFTDGKWQYLPGRMSENGFSPVGSCEASSVKPWVNSQQLRKRLRPRLEDVGVNDPDSFLEKIAEELNRCGRGDYFLRELEEEKIKEEFEPEEIPEIYEEEAERIISSGDVLPEVLKFYGQAHIGDYARKLILFISSLSKKLTGKPINDYSVGTSGKGKSSLARMMVRGIPNECKLVRESISSKYLQYLTRKYGDDCLDGIVLFYDDVTVDEEKEATLKAVSDPLGDEVRHGTVIDQEVVDLKIKGKPVTWVNTVEPFESDQMKNRFLIDQPDESPELDQRVAEFQKEQIRRGILSPVDELDYNVMKAIYRKLVERNPPDLAVLIPFDWRWKYEADRRLEPLFGRLLNVITKIHSPQRVRVGGNGKSYLLATPEDFYIAKFIINSFLVQTASKLTDRQIQVWESLPSSDTPIEEGATRSSASEETQISQGKVREDLNVLMNEGWAIGKRVGKAREWHYRKTQKVPVDSCGEYSQGCGTLDGLKKEFEATLKACGNLRNSLTHICRPRDNMRRDLKHNVNWKGYKSNIMLIWEEYKRNICFSSFAQITQASELQEDDLDSLVEVDHASEIASQLFTTSKQELGGVDKSSEIREEGKEDLGKKSSLAPRSKSRETGLSQEELSRGGQEAHEKSSANNLGRGTITALRKKISDILFGMPLTAAELLSNFDKSAHDRVGNVVNKMAEEEEIYRDKEGRLRLAHE